MVPRRPRRCEWIWLTYRNRRSSRAGNRLKRRCTHARTRKRARNAKSPAESAAESLGMYYLFSLGLNKSPWIIIILLDGKYHKNSSNFYLKDSISVIINLIMIEVIFFYKYNKINISNRIVISHMKKIINYMWNEIIISKKFLIIIRIIINFNRATCQIIITLVELLLNIFFLFYAAGTFALFSKRCEANIPVSLTAKAHSAKCSRSTDVTYLTL